MANYEKLVELLKTVEGDKIHYNKGEKDITSAYGIYRYQQPQAKIFTYIDTVAKDLGITKPSYEWTSEEINLVNINIDKDEEFNLAVDFYKTFTHLDLDQLGLELSYAYFNIFANTPKGANKAMQATINSLISNYNLDYKLLDVDGILGPKSRKVIYDVVKSYNDKELKLTFLVHANEHYINLAVNNSEKYLKYLNGWYQRIKNLIKDVNK